MGGIAASQMAASQQHIKTNADPVAPETISVATGAILPRRWIQITLKGQPRGVELEYRVVVINKAGDSPPSNTEMAVL